MIAFAIVWIMAIAMAVPVLAILLPYRYVKQRDHELWVAKTARMSPDAMRTHCPKAYRYLRRRGEL